MGNNMSVKESWSVVNSILGKSVNKTPTRINFNNKIVTNSRTLAEAFSTIFKDKVEKLRKQTDIEPKIDPVDRLKSWLVNREYGLAQFNLEKIDCLKLRKIINSMKPSRAHGLDFIDSYSIKLAYPIIEDAVLHLVNLSITKYEFAKDWKYQLVLPLHKKNDTLDGNNYRPVSHIIEIGKIVEKVVHKQVYNHFLSHDLFHENHHGFLRNRSTATALLQLYDLWLTAAENRELTASLLLDLSAAFDTVDHGIFLRKLAIYKFSEGSIAWFKSYLEDRTQIVQVQSKFSDPQVLDSYGVPQGSILGPLIFLIFNNDFPASSVEGTSVLYADDDTANVSSCSKIDLEIKLQREANRSTDWVKDNRMVCSGSKTKLLVIGTSQLRRSLLAGTNISVNVCGSTIRDTESEQLLGITVNNDLTWSAHLHGEKWRTSGNHNGLISQLSQRVGILAQLARSVSKAKLNLVSNGLFYSKLQYCLQVFSHVWDIPNFDEESRRFKAFTKDDNRKLQVLQNKVLRLKTGLPPRRPTKDLLKTTGDLSVQQMTAFSTLMTAKKALINPQPNYLSRKLQATKPSARPQTRQQNKLWIQSHLSIARSGFFCQSSALFNLLPHDLRVCEDICVFKRQLKNWVKLNVPIRPDD